MKKIMIVEDEAVIALRLEQRLTEMGYDVTGISHTGEDCVKKARSLLPDLLLMDVMISGDLDGIDAAKIMKEELDIPVIFMTAYTEDQIIERAKEVEPYGYIIKPIRDRELKATIEIALYKKEMERRLQESEEKYRRLFETISDAVIIFDGETRKIIDINDACLSMYGYSKNEFLKLRLHDITAEPEKSEKSTKQAILGEIQKIPLQYHKRNDGEIFPVEIYSGTFSLEDRIVVCGVIRDISKRKQAEKALRESEENFRALAENANDGILIAAGEGEHAYANKHAAEITGYSVSELLKMTIKDLAHPDELKKIKERFRTILAGKPFQKHYETKIIRKDGKEVSIEVASATSIWQGQPADIVIIRDISQRNRD